MRVDKKAKLFVACEDTEGLSRGEIDPTQGPLAFCTVSPNPKHYSRGALLTLPVR